jgi:tripartite ATP-independent transporter DctP family solute receptor
MLAALLSAGFLMGAGQSEGATQEVITLKFGSIAPPQALQSQAIERFIQLVEEKTDGRIKIDYFPGEQLGPADQQIDYVSSGAQDFYQGGTTYWGVFDKRCYLVESPFVFESREHFENWVDKVFYPKVAPVILEKGNQHILNGDVLWQRGPFRVMAARRPIYKPEDMKGLKLRLWPDKVVTTQYKVLGAEPTHIAWTETYTALATGVVDAVTSPLDLLWPMKFTEQVKYVMELKTFPQQNITAINRETWERLTAEQQKIMLEALDEAGRWFNEMVSADAEQTIEKIQSEHRATYIREAEIDRAAFARLAREKGFPILIEEGLVQEEYLTEVAASLP